MTDFGLSNPSEPELLAALKWHGLLEPTMQKHHTDPMHYTHSLAGGNPKLHKAKVWWLRHINDVSATHPDTPEEQSGMIFALVELAVCAMSGRLDVPLDVASEDFVPECTNAALEEIVTRLIRLHAKRN